jgi:uncharacterized OsmC-like protein
MSEKIADPSKDKDLLEPSVDPNKKLLGIRKVSGTNEAGTRTVMKVRSHTVVTDEASGTDTGPTPLETTLASLVGCEAVIINRCATAMRFKYSGVDIEAEGELDQRGSRGVHGVRPYFNWVKLKIQVKTDEPAERFAKLRKNVEYRCPVMNLFRSANVEVLTEWIKVPKGS